MTKNPKVQKIKHPSIFTPRANPYLKKFVERHIKERPYIEEDNHYQKTPYATDTSQGKNDPIYNAHSYHTKVPPKAIEPYILNYTQSGDLILDPFCGSGMTGIAALRNNRKVILIDLSPAATFIAYNYCTPVNALEFHNAVEGILKKVKDEMDWLYETRCRKCNSKAKIEYTILSDIFRHGCGKEFALWDVAVDKETGKVKKEFQCPGCRVVVTKNRLKRIDTKPVRVNYRCPKHGRRENDISEFDIERLRDIEERWVNKISKELWYPNYRMPEGDESRRNDKIGMTHIHHFYTTRNLWALARLWKEINQFKGIHNVKSWLNFSFNSIIILCSKMSRFGKRTGNVSGTLYVPSLIKDLTVDKILYRKIYGPKGLMRALKVYNFSNQVITNYLNVSTQSATNLHNILDDSIDYIFTDPPFGSNLMYSELNFLWEAWFGWFTDNKDEAIINKSQGKGINEYKELMAKSFSEMYRVLKPGRFLTMVFHNSQKEVWDAIQIGLKEGGFDIISVNVLDKKQRSFKGVTAEGAVGYDVVLNCRRLKKLENSFEKNGISKETIDQILKSIKQYIQDAELDEPQKRTIRFIYSKLVEKFGGTVPLNFDKIRMLISSNFKAVDDAYYLWEQLPERKKEGLFEDFEGKLKTELDVVHWLKRFLEQPKEWDEIHAQVYKRLDGTSRLKDPRRILEENFILDKESQRWRMPKPGEERLLKEQREKSLIKEFDSFLREFLDTKSAKKTPDIPVLEAGLKILYDRRDYKTIIELGNKLPEMAKNKIIKGLILAAKAKL